MITLEYYKNGQLVNTRTFEVERAMRVIRNVRKMREGADFPEYGIHVLIASNGLRN